MAEEAVERAGVSGYLHRPAGDASGALVLTHGAGSNCNAALLVAVAAEMARLGWMVLRCNLAFRQQRPGGPPRPADGARDRDGLRLAVEALRAEFGGPVALGGHSYGGRQASMLAAEEEGVADALLLLSYPLHPPKEHAHKLLQRNNLAKAQTTPSGSRAAKQSSYTLFEEHVVPPTLGGPRRALCAPQKPEQVRTGHWPELRTPVYFVHGTRDSFGSVEEMREWMERIPARREMCVVEGAGHDLKGGREVSFCERFIEFSSRPVSRGTGRG